MYICLSLTHTQRMQLHLKLWQLKHSILFILWMCKASQECILHAHGIHISVNSKGFNGLEKAVIFCVILENGKNGMSKFEPLCCIITCYESEPKPDWCHSNSKILFSHWWGMWHHEIWHKIYQHLKTSCLQLWGGKCWQWFHSTTFLSSMYIIVQFL